METITIIGTGLIGCSFGMALREHGHYIVGLDKNLTNLEQAKQIGAIDTTSLSITQSVGQSEIVIIAVPVNTIKNILPKVLDKLPKDAVVIDTGSTKTTICQRVKHHPRREAFVAAHPMAGSEQSGPKSAAVTLFSGKNVAVCEKELSSYNSLTKAKNLFELLGLNVVYINPSEHDLAITMVSHLPQMMAFAYAAMPYFGNNENLNWVKLAASGFNTATRLATSSSNVWLPISEQNNENISRSLTLMANMLREMAHSVKQNDLQTLFQIINQAHNTRKKFTSKQNELVQTSL